MNKINFRSLKKVLNPKEMKNITGGSCDECHLANPTDTCDPSKTCNEGRGHCKNNGMGHCDCEEG